MLVVVQLIKTRWTVPHGQRPPQLCQGTPERLSVMPLPPNGFVQGAVLHHAEFDETNAYTRPTRANLRTYSDLRHLYHNGLGLRLNPIPQLEVLLRLPEQTLSTSLMQLAIGEWGQLSYKTRFGLEREATYTKYVFNITYRAYLDPFVFMRGSPQHTVHLPLEQTP